VTVQGSSTFKVQRSKLGKKIRNPKQAQNPNVQNSKLEKTWNIALKNGNVF
jgi:hypothetical protein